MRNRLIIIVILAAAAAGLAFVLLARHREPAVGTSASVSGHAEVKTMPVVFELIRLSRDGMGVIAGSATPGSFVDVMTDGQSLGKSRAADTGAWEVVISTALATGTHVLSLAATDTAGHETRSADIAVVAVPPPPSNLPPLKTAKGEKKPVPEDGVLAVTFPRQGAGAAAVLQRPGQLRPILTLGLDLAAFDASGATVLCGRATAGDTVNVYLDARPVGTVTANDEGTWTLAVPAIPAGVHNIRLEEIDQGNAVVQNVDQAFDPSPTLAVDPAGAPALVKPDQAVWHVARRLPGGSLRYAQVFRPDQGVAEQKDDKGKAPGVLKPGSDL